MSTSSPRTRNRLGLWALTATHAANDFYTGAVAALLPFFVLHAEYSYAAVAGITLAATALSSVAQPMFGYLSDRYGMRYLPNRIGMASGVTLGLALSLGGLVSPLLGSVADSSSVQSVFVIVAVLLVAGFALSFILEERRSIPVRSLEQQDQSRGLESANG